MDLITGKLTSTISAVAVAIGQAVSLTVTVFTDNGATIEAGATVYARWANTALAAIGGWATQTSNGSGQATFTFTPTLSGESILVINAGARAISIPVKVRAVSAIAISPGYLSLSAGGSKPYYAVALDFSGAEISGLSLTITPSAGAPVVAAGSNPGVAIANVGAARGNYTIAFSSGSITANLDVSVRGSIALNTAPDISVGLASSIQIPRGDTVRAFMFDLEELNTPNPRIGASPSIRLSINNRAPVLASGQAIELGDGRYAWMPRIADVNEEGSMIVLIGESNSKPTTPISVEVVTPYGAR